MRFARYFVDSLPSFKNGTWIDERDAVKAITSVQIINPPKSFSVWFVITTNINGRTKSYTVDKDTIKKHRSPDEIQVPIDLIVNRETKITFYSDESKNKPIFYFWFHTKFTTDKLDLDKRSLDKLKDRDSYVNHFKLILNFADIHPLDIPTVLNNLCETPLKRSSRREMVPRTLRRVKTVSGQDDHNSSRSFTGEYGRKNNLSDDINNRKPLRTKTASHLLDNFLSDPNKPGLPCLSYSSSEDTSYSTDYSANDSPFIKSQERRLSLDPEQDEALVGLLKDIAFKNNVININNNNN